MQILTNNMCFGINSQGIKAVEKCNICPHFAFGTCCHVSIEISLLILDMK